MLVRGFVLINGVLMQKDEDLGGYNGTYTLGVKIGDYVEFKGDRIFKIIKFHNTRYVKGILISSSPDYKGFDCYNPGSEDSFVLSDECCRVITYMKSPLYKVLVKE